MMQLCINRFPSYHDFLILRLVQVFIYGFYGRNYELVDRYAESIY
jgi:hypothetical protein